MDKKELSRVNDMKYTYEIYYVYDNIHLVEKTEKVEFLKEVKKIWDIEHLTTKNSRFSFDKDFKRAKKWLIENHPELMI